MTTAEFLAINLNGWYLNDRYEWWVSKDSTARLPSGELVKCDYYTGYLAPGADPIAVPPWTVGFYTPDKLTPSGLYQCFGPGGVVEKMTKPVEDGGLGFEFDVMDEEDPIEGRKRGYTGEFSIKDDASWVYCSADGDTITAAICEAARKALEWRLAQLDPPEGRS